MGCGQSKGVAPEPEKAAKKADNADNRSDGKSKEAWQPAADCTQNAAAGVAAAVLAHAHATNTHFSAEESSVDSTPRAENSNTTPAAAPPKQQAPLDPEFDYSHELRAVTTAATVPKPPAAAFAGAGASSGVRAGALAPLNTSTAAVGGLLSRQPDWLKDSKVPALPAATYSNTVTGSSAAEVLGHSNSSKHSHAAAGTSSLPPIGQGFGASAAVTAEKSDLPPISGAGLLQQSVTAASGNSATTAALPEPRRLTGTYGNQGRGDASVDAAASAVSSSKGGSARNSGTGAARGSSIGNTAAAGVNRYDGATRTADDEGGLQAPGAGQDESGLSQQQERGSRTTASRESGNQDSGSVDAAAAAAAYDPSDPWSALQSQYVAGAGPPSPDQSTSGQTNSYPAGTAGSNLAAVGNAGSTRATSNTVGTAAQVGTKSSELVLVDSDDDEGAAGFSSSGQVSARHYAGILQPEQLQQRVAPGLRPGALVAESSRARIAAGKPAAGGWGAGNLAAAGTLMLGDEESEGQLRKGYESVAAAPAVQDDVFGEDSPRGSMPGQENSSKRAGNSSGLVGELSCQQGGHGHAAADEELGVEEIDDVDALIEAELAAKSALPGDLAAKLAQFEALAADEDD